MMCGCDEDVGRRFLPHQLSKGTELETNNEYPVTEGFIDGICCECQGLPVEAHPVASIVGRTSKIKRYYWRELAFREFEILAEMLPSDNTQNLVVSSLSHPNVRKEAERLALQEIKKLHDDPDTRKYEFTDESQQSVFERNNVEVVDLKARYIKGEKGKKASMVDGEIAVSAEEFVRRHYQRLGYSTLILESRPMHVLFGTFMWLLIEDPSDPRNRMVSFGSRTAFDDKIQGAPIWTALPDDFGKLGYAQRRATEIKKHFSEIRQNGDLEWLFSYWLSGSERLRQYLWAHSEADIETARKLLSALPSETILGILDFLISDYWGRYLGWPDLLICKDTDFCFVEVKSSSDKLSGDQKNWITMNHELLKLPFKIVKIHKLKNVGE